LAPILCFVNRFKQLLLDERQLRVIPLPYEICHFPSITPYLPGGLRPPGKLVLYPANGLCKLQNRTKQQAKTRDEPSHSCKTPPKSQIKPYQFSCALSALAGRWRWQQHHGPCCQGSRKAWLYRTRNLARAVRISDNCWRPCQLIWSANATYGGCSARLTAQNSKTDTNHRPEFKGNNS